MAKRKSEYRDQERTPPRRVDFFTYAEDLQCVLLANIGLYDQAISDITGLSKGQVSYRLMRAEAGRRKGDPTSRALYRKGNSDVVQTVIKTVVGKNSMVKRQIVSTLDQRGLYTPQPTGVMKHQPTNGHAAKK